MADEPIEEPTIDPAELATERAARQAAERRLAIAEAGVPLNTPLGALFAAGYDGELTSEAITARWQEVAPAPEAPTSEPAAEPEPGSTEFERRQALAAGGTGEATETEDPLDVVMREATDRDTDMVRLQKGTRALLEAAVNGDQRVMVPSRQAVREANYIDPAP